MKSELYYNLISFTFILVLVLAYSVGGQTTGGSKDETTQEGQPTSPKTPKPTTPQKQQTTTPKPSTTVSPAEDCASRNSSCDKCLESAKCLWCGSKSLCVLYPAGDVLPKTSLCPLDEARWGVCWLNFEALIISMSVIGGALILALVICICCCCCCKGKKKSKYLAEEIKYEREKEERKRKSEERRSERKEKNDEIRRKYGLIKEDNPYQRFDNA